MKSDNSEAPTPLRQEPDDDSREEETGYERDDPKHPSYHSRMSDVWDMREGK